MLASFAAFAPGCGSSNDQSNPNAGAGGSANDDAGQPDAGGGGGTVTAADTGAGGRSGTEGGGGDGQAGADGGKMDGGSSIAERYPPSGDNDRDGLTNAQELMLGTDPDRFDTDLDGIGDAEEVGNASAPKDSDGDGVIDALENELYDSDFDGMPDPSDPAEGKMQVSFARFDPAVIANDGRDASRFEIRLVNAGAITRVTMSMSPVQNDPSGAPDALEVDGQRLGPGGAIELFDDGTHDDRVPGDKIYSRGGLTTRMSIRGGAKRRDHFLLNLLRVETAAGATEVEFGFFPTASVATSLPQTPLLDGYWLHVVDTARVVAPAMVRADVQKSDRVVNLARPELDDMIRRNLTVASETQANAPDLASAAHAVFDLLAGDVDFLYAFPDIRLPGAAHGVHFLASSDVQGVGLSPVPLAPAWGSGGRLKAMCLMNLGVRAPLNHETMHQWGIYLDATLGFESTTSHMGFVGKFGVLGGFDPQTLVDHGDGTITVDNFSPIGNDWETPFADLERYLMGLVPASAVTSFPVLKDAQLVGVAGQKITLSGTLETRTIAEIVAKTGARNPDTSTSQKKFDGAFAAFSERLLTPAELSFLDDMAEQFGSPSDPDATTFSEASGGLATMNVALPAFR